MPSSNKLQRFEPKFCWWKETNRKKILSHTYKNAKITRNKIPNFFFFLCVWFLFFFFVTNLSVSNQSIMISVSCQQPTETTMCYGVHWVSLLNHRNAQFFELNGYFENKLASFSRSCSVVVLIRLHVEKMRRNNLFGSCCEQFTLLKAPSFMDQFSFDRAFCSLSRSRCLYVFGASVSF